MKKKPAKTTISKLSYKQKRFVEEYIVDLNAKQAAIRAGYSVRTAEKQGWQMMQHAGIRTAIEKYQKNISKKTEITIENILQEYAKIAFTDLTEIIRFEKGLMSVEDFDKLDDKQKACIKKFKCKTMERLNANGELVESDWVEIELHDKQHALDMLGKHLGMFVQKLEVTDKTPKPPSINLIMPAVDPKLIQAPVQ